MNLVDVNGKPIRSDSDVLQSVPVESIASPRLKPRQTGTGVMHGQQTILSDDKAKLVHGNVPDTQNAFGQTFYDSGGTRRLLFGNYPDGSVKAKLSQENVDVLTATDDQLIWSSDFNSFKISLSSTTTISPPPSWTAGTTLTATIPHNRTITPSFIVYADTPSYGIGAPQESKLTNLPTMITISNATVGGSEIYIYCQAASDNTNLYIYLTNTYNSTTINNSPTWSFRYYVIEETAN